MLYKSESGLLHVIRFLFIHWVIVALALFVYSENFDNTEVAAIIVIILVDILFVSLYDLYKS